MKVIQKYIFASILIGFLVSCGKTNTPEEKAETAVATADQQHKEVELNQAQYKAANISIGPMRKESLTEVVKVNAQTQLPPQSQAEGNSFLSGTITNILVNIGDRVEKGQTIVVANSPELIRLKEEYNVVTNNLSFLEVEYKRQQTLRAENINSEKTYQKIKADLDMERARQHSLGNQLKLANSSQGSQDRSLRITSPISGNIATLSVRIGSAITAGEPLFTVVDNSKMELKLLVFEKDLQEVHVNQKVSFTLTNVHGTSYKAKIFSIGKTFEPGTKTVAVRAHIDTITDNLISGLNANALIHTGTHFVDALPSEAIVKAEGREFIFIQQTADNVEEENHFHFQRVEVKTGVTELGYTAVTLLQPLEVEQNIVLTGAYYLQSHLIKNEGGGGHDH